MEDGELNDFAATVKEFKFVENPFYVHFDTDYRPKLLKTPYLETKKKRAEFEEKQQKVGGGEEKTK